MPLHLLSVTPLSSPSSTRSQHYARQLIYTISFPCANTHRKFIVSIFRCPRVPSCVVAPSHPQSKDRLVSLPQICASKFVPKADMKSRLMNSSYWTLFHGCGFCLIYQCFWHLIVENQFLSSHISAAFFSFLSLSRHAFLILQTNKTNLNRKGVQGHPSVVLLLSGLSAVPRTSTSFLGSFSQNPWLGSASFCLILLKCSHTSGENRAR